MKCRQTLRRTVIYTDLFCEPSARIVQACQDSEQQYAAFCYCYYCYWSYTVSPKACGTPTFSIAWKTVERRKLYATLLLRLESACETSSSLSN
jgi:hypothetical protein